MPPSPSLDRIPVLYIAGAGRSGSTLLEYLIAQRQGFFAVGEMTYLWQRGQEENERCSCGRPFRECPFWNAVLDSALGEPDSRVATARRLRAEQQSLLRHRRLPSLRQPRLQRAAYHRRLVDLTDAYAGIYAEVRRQSGASVIVDSSKSALYGHFLAANPRLDLRVVHLVRDSRAVAHSWQRRKRREESTSAHREFMAVYGARAAARIWLEDNMFSGGLRRHVRHSTLVRYEDLVAQPTAVVDDILRSLGFAEPQVPPIDHAGEGVIRHSVSGNPSRLNTGPVNVSYDATWITEMDSRSRRLVTSMTAPALLRYGYPLISRQDPEIPAS